MENTATWIEDEVFDGVNDNYQYLQTSALSNPSTPVDYGDGFFQYGNWIFFDSCLSTSAPRRPPIRTS